MLYLGKGFVGLFCWKLRYPIKFTVRMVHDRTNQRPPLVLRGRTIARMQDLGCVLPPQRLTILSEPIWRMKHGLPVAATRQSCFDHVLEAGGRVGLVSVGFARQTGLCEVSLILLSPAKHWREPCHHLRKKQYGCCKSTALGCQEILVGHHRAAEASQPPRLRTGEITSQILCMVFAWAPYSDTHHDACTDRQGDTDRS